MVNIAAQRLWEKKENIPLLSLSVMHKTPFTRQYFETGGIVYPARKGIVGTFAGYYYAVAPIFRPGLVIGATFEKKKEWESNLYYGISLQMGIFTVIASGLGYGAGLNIPLKGM